MRSLTLFILNFLVCFIPLNAVDTSNDGPADFYKEALLPKPQPELSQGQALMKRFLENMTWYPGLKKREAFKFIDQALKAINLHEPDKYIDYLETTYKNCAQRFMRPQEVINYAQTFSDLFELTNAKNFLNYLFQFEKKNDDSWRSEYIAGLDPDEIIGVYVGNKVPNQSLYTINYRISSGIALSPNNYFSYMTHEYHDEAQRKAISAIINSTFHYRNQEEKYIKDLLKATFPPFAHPEKVLSACASLTPRQLLIQLGESKQFPRQSLTHKNLFVLVREVNKYENGEAWINDAQESHSTNTKKTKARKSRSTRKKPETKQIKEIELMRVLNIYYQYIKDPRKTSLDEDLKKIGFAGGTKDADLVNISEWQALKNKIDAKFRKTIAPYHPDRKETVDLAIFVDKGSAKDRVIGLIKDQF